MNMIYGDLFIGVNNVKITSPNIINIICHITNNVGAWDAGFVLSINKQAKLQKNDRWLLPKKYYLQDNNILGSIQVIKIDDNIYVVNMCAQNGIRKIGNRPLVNYEALKECLKNVRSRLVENKNIIIHMPHIGTGLGGGGWMIIEKIIEKELENFNVYVYSLDRIN
jgi:hypothetical protein